MTDYSRNLDYRFTSKHAENLTISMWRSDSMIFCQLTGIGDATTVPADEPEETPVPEPVQPTEPDQPAEPVESTVQRMKVVNVNSYVNLRQSPSIPVRIPDADPQGRRRVILRRTGRRLLEGQL